MSDFLIPVGQKVTWTSESQGTAKTKVGIVRLHLPKWEAGKKAFDDFCKCSPEQEYYLRSVSSFSGNDRYLVEVQRTHAITGDPLKSKWYSPLKSTIESQSQSPTNNTTQKPFGFSALEQTDETDYRLVEEASSCWVQIDRLSVYIRRNDEGVSVDIYPAGSGADEAIASACAFFSDVDTEGL